MEDFLRGMGCCLGGFERPAIVSAEEGTCRGHTLRYISESGRHLRT